MGSPQGGDLIERVRQQLGFLERSLRDFYERIDEEALRIATTIRVLVHKTTRSTPLLERVDRSYETTIRVPDKAAGMPGDFLEQVRRGNVFLWSPIGMKFEAGRISPYFSVEEGQYRAIPLGEWWARAPALVIGDEILKGPRTFTRRDLVLILANKEGGAHVDEETVPEEYRRLIVNRGPRLMVGGVEMDRLNAAYWVCAQSGVELVHGVREAFPELR